MPWVIMIFCIVSVFFFSASSVFLSNPFEIISPVPLDGARLKPAARRRQHDDPTRRCSTPASSVSLSPYAFAMAALIVGKLDEAWIVSTRRWTITAWFFLTIGNLVGAWWSYHVLGWGGYWGVGSGGKTPRFMPWLPATALFCTRSRFRSEGAC